MREKLDLNSRPDPNEIVYACFTNNLKVIEYTAGKIDRSTAHIAKASQVVFIHPDLIELLIKNRLFKLEDPKSIEKFFSSDFIEELFPNAPDKNQLFRSLIHSIHPEDRANLK